MTGRTAAVAGASSGIGLATARHLAELGATVAAMARRLDALPTGPRLRPHRLDVTDAGAVAALTPRLAPEGTLDVLVCAAGTNLPERRMGELTPAGWRALVDTNLTGVFHVVDTCLPALRAARGLVIVVGSVSGAWPDLSGPGYQAAKAGVAAFARAAGLEEHEHGVRFSTVMPGLVDTLLLDRRPEPPSAEDRARPAARGRRAGVRLPGLAARPRTRAGAHHPAGGPAGAGAHVLNAAPAGGGTSPTGS